MWKGLVRGFFPVYHVEKIILFPDSTYTNIDYKWGKKKDIKNYEKWEKETFTGVIYKQGKYFRMVEYKGLRTYGAI